MATETEAAPTLVTPYRLDVSQYLKMIEAGVFADRSRVELLNGVLVRKMTKNTPHNFAMMQLAESFRGVVPPAWFVNEEKSLVLARFWRPEPDIAVLRGPVTLYRGRDPHAADVALVLEVSDSSYSKDRGMKWRGYAEAKIPIYWVVNLSQSRVEVYTDPEGQGRSASYRQCVTFGPDQSVPIVIEGVEVGQVLVRDLLA